MTLYGHLKTLHCIFEIWHQRIQKFIKSQLKADLIWPELLYLQSKIKEKKNQTPVLPESCTPEGFYI